MIKSLGFHRPLKLIKANKQTDVEVSTSIKNYQISQFPGIMMKLCCLYKLLLWDEMWSKARQHCHSCSPKCDTDIIRIISSLELSNIHQSLINTQASSLMTNYPVHWITSEISDSINEQSHDGKSEADMTLYFTVTSSANCFNIKMTNTCIWKGGWCKCLQMFDRTASSLLLFDCSIGLGLWLAHSQAQLPFEEWKRPSTTRFWSWVEVTTHDNIWPRKWRQVRNMIKDQDYYLYHAYLMPWM